ncbi:hypothetical protein [Winogradskyella psychrotolerans]|uniref:hypothetical protein n=1 Tax=Winogradskyella psychrotolerans TaxID=1344585 RepID=UPI001C072DAC|nr:hypothetical protein [Winogradskyella psychrotolerans]MBU2929619.1 hypothetical protein [Winogradskyella psychrotolerans]
MIHLIWSIINLIMVLYFLYLIVGFIKKGKRIFNPKFKVISIFVMVIGIVQVISAANSKEKTNRITISNNYNKKNFSKVEKVTLEDNLTFDINMHIIYSIEQTELIPIESNSFLTGFVSGYEWEFTSIETTKSKQAEFIANGVLKWNLFGITVYNESKTFSGIKK